MKGESIYYFGGALGLLVFNFLSDNIGRKKVLTISILIGSLVLLIIYLVDLYYVIIILFFFEGAGIEVFSVMGVVYISEISSKSNI